MALWARVGATLIVAIGGKDGRKMRWKRQPYPGSYFLR